MNAESTVRKYFNAAGIEVNGSQPGDIQVKNPEFYQRVMSGGSLGLGESYMDEWWDVENLEEFLYKLIVWRNENYNSPALRWTRLWFDIKRVLFNLQTPLRSKEVIDTHYDLSPELFQDMLGETMAYSCAYWKGANSLDQAQRNKFDLICRKLELKESDRVLDLGCGFGSFSRYAAENYGCTMVAVTLSANQAAYARGFCKDLPVEVHVTDYRNTSQYTDGKPFDKVASIAMFEAIGRKNFRGYMELVDRVLPQKGLWLLHTIGDEICSSDPWLEKYIFPNGELPTTEQISIAIKNLFDLEDFHNFGLDYRRTLAEWEANFRGNWEIIKARNAKIFDTRFFRMWIYYLNACQAAFRSRNMLLWHFVMSKGYLSMGYESVR